MNKLKYEIEKYLILNFNKIKINSKDIKKDDVFVALKGSYTHGSNFIKNAFSNGAKYVVTDEKTKDDFSKYILKVKNSYDFLNKVAIKKRNNFSGKVIAITGSVGKTSIKELLKYFLSFEGTISASIKSYNNYLGVLISLINMNNNSSFSIFEVGTNNFNEIKKLASLIRPQQVIISNIYPTHIQNFGSTRNIAVEKSDLFNPKHNPKIELIILQVSNEDEIYLKEKARKHLIKSIMTFGKKDLAEYSIVKIKTINNFLSEIIYETPLRKIEFKASTYINHHILNMLIVVMVYDFNRLSIKNFLEKTASIPFIEGRGLINNIIINKKEVKLIDESYNASPVSMNNCIDYFEHFMVKEGQKKLIVIGEMLELGEMSKKFHLDIVSKTIRTSIDIIIFCGKIYKEILFQQNINLKKIYYFEDESKILNFLNINIHNNDIILVKGSNSSKVNKLVHSLLKKNKEINC